MIDDVLSGRQMWSIEQGDCRQVLAAMPPESVHMCVTSIPYWALRAYGTEPQIWGATDLTCQHEWQPTRAKRGNGSGGQVHEGNEWAANFGRSDYTEYGDRATYSDVCGKCGAWRGELGLEPTIDLYVAHIVEVFRAVWRVLRRDGTIWVNCGDSYSGSGKGAGQVGLGPRDKPLVMRGDPNQEGIESYAVPAGLKPKDLCMIPARVALALQADGWWLRSEIVWCKKAPMPESCQDRPTSATEKIFLLSKSERYYYDATAVAEPSESGHPSGNGYKRDYQLSRDGRGSDEQWQVQATRNLRNYWVLGPEPMRDDHYAAYPTEIPKRAILAGSSEKGVCPNCGAPWRRVVEKVPNPSKEYNLGDDMTGGAAKTGNPQTSMGLHRNGGGVYSQRRSLPVEERHGRVGHNGKPPQQSGWFWTPSETVERGWRPSCKHDREPVGAIVLDPFAGSGTSILVALRHGRRGIGVDLKPSYVEMARRRIEGDPLANNMRMSLEEVAG